jgi:hypothetical protein
MSSCSPILLLLLLLPADIIHRTNSVRERNADVRGAFVPKVPIRFACSDGGVSYTGQPLRLWLLPRSVQHMQISRANQNSNNWR